MGKNDPWPLYHIIKINLDIINLDIHPKCEYLNYNYKVSGRKYRRLFPQSILANNY